MYEEPADDLPPDPSQKSDGTKRRSLIRRILASWTVSSVMGNDKGSATRSPEHPRFLRFLLWKRLCAPRRTTKEAAWSRHLLSFVLSRPTQPETRFNRIEQESMATRQSRDLPFPSNKQPETDAGHRHSPIWAAHVLTCSQMSLPTAPKTPAPLNRVQQTDYQSTPSNQNASATSQGLRTWTVPEIRPLLAKDVTQFNLGKLDRYLYHILRKVGAIKAHVVGGKEIARPSDEVIRKGLQDCLEEIDKAAQKRKGLMKEIDNAFKAYSKGQTEAARYASFVKVSNKILALLKDVGIEGCPAAVSGDDELQFMVHDSRQIQSEHRGGTYGRKPDVVLSRRKYITPLYAGEVKTSGINHLMTNAPPGKFLPWEQGLMHSEFKKGSSSMPVPTKWRPVIGSESGGTYETKEQLEQEIEEAMRPAAVEAESETLPTSVASGSRARRSKATSSNAAKPRIKSQPSMAKSTERKVKVMKETEADRVAAVQLGEYAAESLYNTFGREHIMGLLINGANINIWHYDHEAPVQMTGFDFLKNPQYFFLLLLAIQRFSNEDWGFLPGFDKLVGLAEGASYTLDLADCQASAEEETGTSPAGQQTPAEVVSDGPIFTGEKGNMKRPQFGLIGRATGVLYGAIGQREVAIKLSYPEKCRDREKEFVDRAKKDFDKRGYEDYNPCDYLPEILAAKEYTEFQSGPLRQAVLEKEEGYASIERANRVPYLLAMPKYDPISSLTTDWEVFLGAFFALFYCHAMLWSIGIRHGDISESNLMWDPIEQKPKLCDFDLSHFAEPPTIGQEEKPVGPKGYSNTGTWIFMADELLTPLAMEGKVKRVYRHEVESFIAVLVWVACQYKDGELQKPAPLDEWNDTLYERIVLQRDKTYTEIAKRTFTRPFALDAKLWGSITVTIMDIRGFLAKSKDARTDQDKYEFYQEVDPDLAASSKPDTPPHDFDTLRSLLKIFTWPIFKHPRAEPFVRLAKERIGLAGGNSAPPST
ncbi:hypothetical protein NMY22_g13840 [Coprinellus aureogranulatus]|nr:hypothetical protein NMY22_g13840 [Coprinellus aureogranulatus]